MPKSERLSSADKPENLDKAYASALKALSTLGIKMETKKPDNGKVAGLMAKNKKPAEFKLVSDKARVKLMVECGSAGTELGMIDAEAARDPEKRQVILDNLVSAGLMSKSEADKLMAGVRKGPDPKVAANEIRKKIAEIKTKLEPYEKIKSWDAAAKNPAYFKELEAQLKLEHSVENMMFIAAVEKKFSRDKIMAAFIGDKAKYQVNLPASMAQALERGGTDFGPALTEVKKMVAKDTMPRLKKRMEEVYKKQLDALGKELAKVGA